MKERIIVVGTGGFARELVWLIREMQQAGTGPELAGLVGETPPEAGSRADLPWLGTDAELFAASDRSLRFVVAIGNPGVRLRVAQMYENQGFLPALPLLHPAALVGAGTRIAAGSVVCAGAILTTDIVVEAHSIINLHCSVGHDCRLGRGVTLHPGVRLSGAVHLGEGAELGTGAIVLPGLTVAVQARVGAGAVVTRPLTEPGGTFVGIPARLAGM